ncbi:MAG TPA: molybdate ABC transporter substrate-binding protein [Terriglobales bacterium]|jgi:molybdate transport system substrate-binding protein|nr:molybdate ABC transporter substrate-binding protein [Terriglobales bacterium]
MRTLAIVILAFLARPAAAAEITVAAASDLTFALTEIASQFEKETGNSVRLTFGSSGNLAAQIQNGAPFDVFFSADIDYPRRLEARRLVDSQSLFLYATGKIVLWAARGSPINVQRGMDALLDPAVRKIAIANPAHAPYGHAAAAALRHFKIYERVQKKLVFGENISQAALFVESGNADIGIIALSIALAPTMKDMGSFWEVPQSAYPPLQQAAVIVSNSRQKKLAEAFLAYVRMPQGLATLERYGFSRPGEKP